MRIFIISTLVLLFTKFAFSKGHDQGNGGNIIECPRLNKTLSLDYVLTKELFEDQIKLVKVKNLEASFLRISKLLKAKVPAFDKSFSDFVNNVNNYTDDTRPYLWENVLFDQENLKDQSIDYLPSFCRSGWGSVAWISQVITRYQNTANQNRVLFSISHQAIGRLDSLQKSFLYVHEWLWSISSDVVQNRSINYFFHSELFEKLSADEVVRQLQAYGVNLNESRQSNFY